MTASSFKFIKSYRLLKPAQFRQVFDNTKRKVHAKHLMGFISDNDCGHPRLGLAITKKKVPTAVARNRLKRLTREQFRLSADTFASQDVVIIAKRPLQALTNAQLTEEIKQLLSGIQ